MYEDRINFIYSGSNSLIIYFFRGDNNIINPIIQKELDLSNFIVNKHEKNVTKYKLTSLVLTENIDNKINFVSATRGKEEDLFFIRKDESMFPCEVEYLTKDRLVYMAFYDKV